MDPITFTLTSTGIESAGNECSPVGTGDSQCCFAKDSSNPVGMNYCQLGRPCNSYLAKFGQISQLKKAGVPIIWVKRSFRVKHPLACRLHTIAIAIELSDKILLFLTLRRDYKCQSSLPQNRSSCQFTHLCHSKHSIFGIPVNTESIPLTSQGTKRDSSQK